MEKIVFLAFFAVLFVVLAVVVLYTVISNYKKHYSVTGNVVNYDYGMKTFVFKVPHAKEEIIELLKIKNVNDDLEYVFNPEDLHITFSKIGHVDIEYRLLIEEHENYCVLHVENSRKRYSGGQIPILVNPFFVKKLNAEVAPFSKAE